MYNANRKLKINCSNPYLNRQNEMLTLEINKNNDETNHTMHNN